MDNFSAPPPKPGDGLSTVYRIGGKHPGFKKCRHCGVAGYVTEPTITKALRKGLEDAKFQIVSVAKKGEREGTFNVMLRPLMNMLRSKGMVVR
jgi:hypothetical protein